MVLAVLTDLACYWIFLNLLPEEVANGTMRNEVVAKALSFLCGLLVTYQFNKRWTWRRKDRNNRRLVKFMLTYGISLVLNVVINTGMLELVAPPAALHQFAVQVLHRLRSGHWAVCIIHLLGPEVLDLPE